MDIDCPHCAQLLSVTDRQAGRTCDCPLCGNEFTAPGRRRAAASTVFLAVGAAALLVAVVLWIRADPGISHERVQSVLVMTGVIFGVAIYFLTTIAARGKKNANAIFILNLFLGWTLLGWVVALVWANMED